MYFVKNGQLSLVLVTGVFLLCSKVMNENLSGIAIGSNLP